MSILIGLEDLISGFEEVGLTPGDVVLVHSSYLSFGELNEIKGGPQTVINALLTLLTEEGTLIMPTFNFQFCNDYNEKGEGFFDLDKTPSRMGTLTNLVRKMPNAKRTVNPIYSVAIVGKLSNQLSKINDKNVFGKNSIFGKLHQLNGKIMIIGLSWNEGWTLHIISKIQLASIIGIQSNFLVQ